MLVGVGLVAGGFYVALGLGVVCKNCYGIENGGHFDS